MVKEAGKKLDPKEILFQSEKIILVSTKPYHKIHLHQKRYVFIWGDMYAIKRPNGTYDLIDMAIEKETGLKEMFEIYSIAEGSRFIEGNFVGVLVGPDNEAVVFGDSFNRTEVFYTLKKDGAIVSTDLEALIEEDKDVKYSQIALSNLLTVYGYYAPKKHTIYEHIKRLGVGERLVVEDGLSKVEQSPFIPKPNRPFGDREHHEYADIFEDSVRSRASAGCNWVFLSSGWDSTSLLAVLVKQYGSSKVRAITGKQVYSDRAGTINQFELDRAQKVADYYGVQLDIVPMDLCRPDCVDYWKDLRVSLKRQHIYSPAAYNYYRLLDHFYKQAGSKDVVFAGEISDGAHNLGFSQFATILEHPDLGFREYSDKMSSYLFGPTFFNSVLENNYRDDAVYKLLRARAGTSAFEDEQELDETSRRLKYFASFFLRNTRLPFYGGSNTTLLTNKGAKNREEEFIKVYLEEAAMNATPDTLYSWILYLYNSFHWQGSTVRMLNAKCDERGEKIKLPFWDGRMQQFLSEMPENWGRGLEIRPTKYPLKWMLQNRIDYPLHLQTGPHAYLYDVNPQFSHASEMLFGSYLSNYLKELVKNYPYEKLLEEDFFNLSYIRKLVDDYRSGVELTGSQRSDLMSIVALCLTGWY